MKFQSYPTSTVPSRLKLPTLSALRSVPPRKRWPSVTSASSVEKKLASSDSSQDEIIIWMILCSKDGGLYNVEGFEDSKWFPSLEMGIPYTMNWRPTVEQTNKNIKKHIFEKNVAKCWVSWVAITHSYLRHTLQLAASHFVSWRCCIQSSSPHDWTWYAWTCEQPFVNLLPVDILIRTHKRKRFF